MSYTVSQVVKAALQRILVQASEADLEAAEYQDAILALNVMMAAWEADGVKLGYTDVSDLADTITVPNAAIRGIIANLAIEVAPDYSGKTTPTLYKQADEGYKSCLKLAQKVIPTQYPSTLPSGSGNSDGYRYADTFYPNRDWDGTLYDFKDPDSVQPFTMPWEDVLTPAGDTISSSSWAADSSVIVDSDTNTTLDATAVVSGGDVGQLCNLVNTIVTANGSTYERTIVLDIREA